MPSGPIGDAPGRDSKTKDPDRSPLSLAAVDEGADIGGFIRPLLEALAKLAAFDSTYLIVFDWERREQEVRFVFSADGSAVEEGHRMPLAADVAQEAFPGVTKSPQVVGRSEPDSVVARSLGLKTFVSVPVTSAKHRLFGMLCGASRRLHEVSEAVVGLFESFAGVVGEHLAAMETQALEVQIEALKERANLAESQLLARARFLAEAEHRMKTPLSILGGTSLTLRDRRGELSDAARAELEDSIVRNVVILSQELESLLVEARADVRSRELRPRDVNLGSMVREISRAFDGLGLAHHVVADIAGDLTAHVDPTAASQVLGHLIDNAIKYSPDGGSIGVKASQVDGKVVIQVVDEGVGLPPSVDVFEAFRRGHQDIETPGIGLGLHIVRSLVEAMDGTVSARNNAEAGATFTVTLPQGGDR